MKNSTIVPDGVMRPIRPLAPSVNHRLPSGPGAMPYGCADEVLGGIGIGYSVTLPLGVMSPILSRLSSTNQMFPSGPGAIDRSTPPVGPANSVILPPIATGPAARSATAASRKNGRRKCIVPESYHADGQRPLPVGLPDETHRAPFFPACDRRRAGVRARHYDADSRHDRESRRQRAHRRDRR